MNLPTQPQAEAAAMHEELATAQTKAIALGGLLRLLLEFVAPQLLGGEEKALEGKVASNLHRGNHDLPGDAALFVRHATRQFVEVAAQSVIGHHAGGLADRVRDFEVPRIAPTVVPQITSSTTTAQGVSLVGAALVADLESLIGVAG